MKFMQIEHEQKANPVEIWIVYDNVPAGKCAKELCDRLQQQLGTIIELRVNPGMWPPWKSRRWRGRRF